jgi:hypothetical protein
MAAHWDWAMPWGAPKSLTDQEVYSLTAYLLHLNGIIGEANVIDAETLPRCRCPTGINSSAYIQGNHSTWVASAARGDTFSMHN